MVVRTSLIFIEWHGRHKKNVERTGGDMYLEDEFTPQLSTLPKKLSLFSTSWSAEHACSLKNVILLNL